MTLYGEDDYRAWVFTLASSMACVGGAALIFIDIVLKNICRRDVRLLQNHRFLAGSLGLGSGVMVYSSFYNILPEAKEQLSHELSIFASHVDAFVMLFFFSGVGAMMLVHWIMHRFNSSSSPGIEHGESIQYFMPPEEQYRARSRHHQDYSSLHKRYSTPFQQQHSQYAPNAYFNEDGKHDIEEDDHGHDTESRYQNSVYVDDEVTSLLNNAFLQIGATPASQIEEAMNRRRKKELQRQRRQRSSNYRQGSSDLEVGGDGFSENDDDGGLESIEVVINDPHARTPLGSVAANHVKNTKNNRHHQSPHESASSWSSVSSDSDKAFAPNHNNSNINTVRKSRRNRASTGGRSRRRFRDSGHFHYAHHHKPSSAVQHHHAGQHTSAKGAESSHKAAAEIPPPIHHTYQTFGHPLPEGGKSSNGTVKSTYKGNGVLQQYPYSNHSKGSEETSRGTMRRTSFPRLNHTNRSSSTPSSQHQHQHPVQKKASKYPQHAPNEQQALLFPHGRRGSDPLTSSRHDILDHAATDDREHTELADIGIQTAFTIAIHKFPEGLITFLSTTGDPCLGFSVFMALAVHNIIEGYLIAFPLYIGLRSRTKAFAFAAILGGLSQPIGALLGWVILRKVMSLGWQVSAMGVIYAIVAGMMSSIAVNGMWPQAVKCAGRQPTKVVPISFFAGIAIIGACQAAMGSKCKT